MKSMWHTKMEDAPQKCHTAKWHSECLYFLFPKGESMLLLQALLPNLHTRHEDALHMCCLATNNPLQWTQILLAVAFIYWVHDDNTLIIKILIFEENEIKKTERTEICCFAL